MAATSVGALHPDFVRQLDNLQREIGMAINRGDYNLAERFERELLHRVRGIDPLLVGRYLNRHPDDPLASSPSPDISRQELLRQLHDRLITAAREGNLTTVEALRREIRHQERLSSSQRGGLPTSYRGMAWNPEGLSERDLERAMDDLRQRRDSEARAGHHAVSVSLSEEMQRLSAIRSERRFRQTPAGGMSPADFARIYIEGSWGDNTQPPQVEGEKEKAHKKSLELLKQYIGDDLYKEFEKNGAFTVKGKHGSYKFPRQGEITFITTASYGTKKRNVKWKLCLEIKDQSLPVGDVLATKFLELKSDEDKFLEACNFRSISTDDEFDEPSRSPTGVDSYRRDIMQMMAEAIAVPPGLLRGQREQEREMERTTRLAAEALAATGPTLSLDNSADEKAMNPDTLTAIGVGVSCVIVWAFAYWLKSL